MFRIGPFQLDSRVLLAPMAGISDRPFRVLCRQHGAALAATEMLSSNPLLQNNRRSHQKRIHKDEVAPRVVQIAGADPLTIADAARLNEDQGAQIIDINMGCPVKKILNQASGSALLKDEALVARILESVVKAVSVPVTLKIRTGWSPEQRNGVTIARIAEDAGIQALAVHGRTRACMFNGNAEYDTIAAIKQSIKIPVIANGDINTPEQARYVLQYTAADAVMIGRGARGRPWIFREINHFLQTGFKLPALTDNFVEKILLAHVRELHSFYGDHLGLGYTRKHVAWYLETYPGAREFRSVFNKLDSQSAQIEHIEQFFVSVQQQEHAA
ncbi:MAG: tRNA dihydrouridine synthase DusB [Pseudomonadota bacterium]